MEVEKQNIQNNNEVQQVSGKHPKDWVDVGWMRFVLLFLAGNLLKWINMGTKTNHTFEPKPRPKTAL